MAPELFDETISYGTEVDIWAFGAMAFEMAFGQPPNVSLGLDFSKLGSHLKQHSPRLQGEYFSAGLKGIVAFCLQNDRTMRPAIDQVRRHKYIVNTESQFPTLSLSHLVRAFKLWEAQGGDRRSLFSAGGAQVLEENTPTEAVDGDWNFSTTAAFDQQVLTDGRTQDIYDVYGSDVDLVENSPEQEATKENKTRPRRGPPKNLPTLKQPLEKLFDPNTLSNYEENSRQYYMPFQLATVTDLPLRDEELPSANIRESLIDLDESLNGSRLSQFAELDTLKPNISQTMGQNNSGDGQPAQSTISANIESNINRRTQDWKFPTMVFAPTGPDYDGVYSSSNQELLPELRSTGSDTLVTGFDIIGSDGITRPERTASIGSLIDLDMSIVSAHVLDNERPSTSHSGVDSIAGSEIGAASPFEFEKHVSLYFDDDSVIAMTERPYSLSEFADTDPEIFSYGQAQDISHSMSEPFQGHDDADYDDIEVATLSISSIIKLETSFPLPPEPPAFDVMQGQSSPQDVKRELQRMAMSLSEHLSHTRVVLSCLPVRGVNMTQANPSSH